MKARNALRSVGVLLAGIGLAGVAQGHHSVAAEFDQSKEVNISGAVTDLEWTNPHSWVYLDVRGENGEIKKWQCELGAPNRYVRAGWLPADLPMGTVVNISGNPARDGSNTCVSRDITTMDGSPLFDGPGPHSR